MKELALALSLTILFEEALMIGLNLKQKNLGYRMLVTFVMNCLTNPLLNLMILLFEIRSASVIILLETAVVLTEAFVWHILTKDSAVRSLMMALLLNVFSYTAGGKFYAYCV